MSMGLALGLQGSALRQQGLFIGRFTWRKSDLHKHYKTYEDMVIVLAQGCPIEVMKCPEDWIMCLCTHFQEEKYLVRELHLLF